MRFKIGDLVKLPSGVVTTITKKTRVKSVGGRGSRTFFGVKARKNLLYPAGLLQKTKVKRR